MAEQSSLFDEIEAAERDRDFWAWRTRMLRDKLEAALYDGDGQYRTVPVAFLRDAIQFIDQSEARRG